MKRIKTLLSLKSPLVTNLLSNDIYIKSLAPLSVLILTTIIIWVGAPYLTWHDFAPLANSEKRLYVILSLFLIWLLKFLIVDLPAPSPFHYKDPQTRKRLQISQNRFKGAIQFLKQTTTTKHDKQISLYNLPWYLLIGPASSGKTTLLANSEVNFILQKQFQDQNRLQQSDYCDWWVTKDVSIIDVPGSYLTSLHQGKKQPPMTIYTILWRFFLRCIKKERGKNGLEGILIALPLPEFRQKDSAHFQTLLQNLFQRLADLKKIFPDPIPCHLIITKCDLISGFSEYFAESGNDELSQAWGVLLSPSQKNQNIAELFASRFDRLIKKLNQQLIWRLHLERNPKVRPYIKNFPLQIEHVKELIIDFIKTYSKTSLKLSLQSVHLMSATQFSESKKAKTHPPDTAQSAASADCSMQIFKKPASAPRSYFIKQFFTQGLGHFQPESIPHSQPYAWKNKFLFIVSIFIIVITAVFLGRDFQQGINKIHFLQTNFSNYHLSAETTRDPDQHLAQTLALLNSLKRTTETTHSNLSLNYLLHFYSHKSQEKTNASYQQALQTILRPQIQNYFSEYLKVPVNKSTDHVYSALTAYLMLGDEAHFQRHFITNTIQEILPHTFSDAETAQLMEHINAALNKRFNPHSLDPSVINAARHYLAAIPSIQLAYTLLKNINNNDTLSEIDLGTNPEYGSIFVSKIISQIPTMFTAKSFNLIVSQDTRIAAREAISGNWVLGENFSPITNPNAIPNLIEQLRFAYINNYVAVWESLVTNIQLSNTNNLQQTYNLLSQLIRNNSPLIHLLQTLHKNTYFEPIITYSPKLQALGELIAQTKGTENKLYQIFSGLKSTHHYVQTILKNKNEKKAAYAVSLHQLNNQPDALIQLRLAASNSPEPIKSWLDKISNDVWHLLMQDASQTMDTSWQMVPVYEKTDNFTPLESPLMSPNKLPAEFNQIQIAQLHSFHSAALELKEST